MSAQFTLLAYITVMFISIVKAPVPGTFFWKPRIGIVLHISSTPSPQAQSKVSVKASRGLEVEVEGFHFGMVLLAVTEALESQDIFKDQSFYSPYFYTNAYRWALRSINLAMGWVASQDSHYLETQNVWTNRYLHMDTFVPNWMRFILNLYVNSEDWEREEKEYKKYVKYGIPVYGRYYTYPSKKFNDFKSQQEGDSHIALSNSYFSFNKVP